ncbi:hypothetical protein QCM80_35660 [Bradyrhizobium sp. SSUT112]|uniref:hypothetical protein n=1 Tax=Bradyrhizobium sp. SSUT112 TaxID=3040604 RepID=UPI00244D1F9E|nr:hypothetical protein [Bradyrhizobium sp. SSUT112]MDH2355967.1 hypothetical protein [Bradyrhizobium sp. SSUT112]
MAKKIYSNINTVSASPHPGTPFTCGYIGLLLKTTNIRVLSWFRPAIAAKGRHLIEQVASLKSVEWGDVEQRSEGALRVQSRSLRTFLDIWTN